jgi:hypothetical protein
MVSTCLDAFDCARARESAVAYHSQRDRRMSTILPGPELRHGDLSFPGGGIACLSFLVLPTPSLKSRVIQLNSKEYKQRFPREDLRQWRTQSGTLRLHSRRPPPSKHGSHHAQNFVDQQCPSSPSIIIPSHTDRGPTISGPTVKSTAKSGRQQYPFCPSPVKHYRRYASPHPSGKLTENDIHATA